MMPTTAPIPRGCFNAARGFVGGAAADALGPRDEITLVSMPHAAIPFRPHHRFAVPLPRSRRGGLVTLSFLAESRNISFPRRCGGGGERSEPIGALMPHAALWVVQRETSPLPHFLAMFQCRTRLCGWCNVLCTVSIIAETTPNDKCFPMQQKSRCMAAFLYLPSLSWMRGIIIFHRSKDKIN